MIEINKIHRRDAVDGLKKLDDESVDLVVTDPPYNIAVSGRRTFRNGRPVKTTDVFGHWDCLHPFDHELLILQVISECYRVLKPGGALYMFSARQDSGHFIRKAVERGFTYRNQLVMIKTPPLPAIFRNCWRSAFETCLYVTKGKRVKTFNFLSQQECVNVFNYSVRDLRSDHPTEKPLEFIRRLVAVSSNPGNLVLDPFMGSGTTAVACKQLGRSFVGFELDRSYTRMAQARLDATAHGQSGAAETSPKEEAW